MLRVGVTAERSSELEMSPLPEMQLDQPGE